MVVVWLELDSTANFAREGMCCEGRATNRPGVVYRLSAWAGDTLCIFWIIESAFRWHIHEP